ncbi:hypothetical protein F5Y05DRAFT_314108 [Hypoxylon sp. FL0543]|nr:hypothetical protein F5Y05DRAFT_314108 [Hypoxylon sp. FL0543]
MVENFHFERLNAIMKDARNSDEAFGGVQLVVTGDFYQLPPVKPFKNCITCGRTVTRPTMRDGRSNVVPQGTMNLSREDSRVHMVRSSLSYCLISRRDNS